MYTTTYNEVENLCNNLLTNSKITEHYDVSYCASTVRATLKTDRNTYIQKNANELEALWKVFINGYYVCGMETIHDAIRLHHLELLQILLSKDLE